MDIESLKRRIEAKKIEIDKIQKKIQKLESKKTKEGFLKENDWIYGGAKSFEEAKKFAIENNRLPVEESYEDYIKSLDGDIKRANRDLEDAQSILNKYQSQIDNETSKEGTRNIKVILDFLKDWKERVYTIYEKAINDCFEMVRKLKDAWGTEEYKDLKKEYSENLNGSKTESGYKKEGKWQFISPYISRYNNPTKCLDRVKKDLEDEANRKYDFIVKRVNELVGEIKDASDLRIGTKGDLNGFIEGTNGTVHVQTVEAGGYNKQIFHFRTLFNKLGG